MKLHDPILTPEESKEFEKSILGDSQLKAYKAMELAGEKLADSLCAEFGKYLGASPSVLGLVGAGHNGGDALVALARICKNISGLKLTVAIPKMQKLRPNTLKAFWRLQNSFSGKNLEIIDISELEKIEGKHFDLILEGLTAMSFTPPMRGDLKNAIISANRIQARLKVSVDIPAGAYTLPQSTVFKADATYATGIAKTTLFYDFNKPFAGRIRYLDIGFFDSSENPYNECKRDFITRPDALEFLKILRPSASDKRGYGHLFIVGGSQSYPGAVMINAGAAIRGGCGLVTAFVPEPLAPAYAAMEPSVIWVGCPQDESGALALESFGLIKARLKYASALAIGSGLTASAESTALVCEILKASEPLPTVLDADAIRPQILAAATNRKLLLTPHEGEFLRIAPDTSDCALLETCKRYGCACALKSSITRISDGKNIVRSTRGSPVLSRAGSGDILAGLSGALMCNQNLQSPMDAGICASQWLGISAEKAFYSAGSESPLASSDIIKFISSGL